MNELLQRLKNRKVVQWALAYLAGAWVLLQVCGLIGQQFDWPTGLLRGITVTAGVGFFVVLLLAWYHGERGAQRVTGTELTLLTLLLAIGGVVLWRVAPSPGTADSKAPALAQAVASAPVAAAVADRKSIAVLPFENLSDDKANAYFASGMQDMILTKLAAIAELTVISRTSTEKYASHPENLKLVAQQLGVATILEGSVQKAGNQVLINVQLIEAAGDKHLWADAYQRTMENMFGVEGEVAEKVADALKATLTPAETARVTNAPTQNAAAYDWFLQAEYRRQQAENSWQEADYLAADELYHRAIDLDPQFALAHANLARGQLSRHWLIKPLGEAALADVKNSIDHALAASPNLPEAHLALGYYEYWGFRRYDSAVVEFQRVLQLAPSNSEAVGSLGFIARRRGEWQQALTYLQQALILAPRSAMMAHYGATLSVVRRYAEADRQLKQAWDLVPNSAGVQDDLLAVKLFGLGDIDGARRIFGSVRNWRTVGQAFAGDVMYLVGTRVYPDVFDRKFAAALAAWDSASADTDEGRRARQMAQATIRLIAGQREAAQPDCQALAPGLERDLAREPDSLIVLQEASWIDVCLGRNADAIAAARRAVALRPVEQDAYDGPNELVGLAQIDAFAGAPDEALTVIRRLLEIPAGEVMSIERLERDPVWDPLRGDARFVELTKRPIAAAGGTER